jgi:hypothetical protein
MANKKIELLIRHARSNPNWEATKAETMFRKFISGKFSYDELSNHPDYPVYASAEVLAIILPLIIDEMLARGDTINFLIYHVIAAVDPFGEGRASNAERAEELIGLVDQNFAEKVLKILTMVKDDPPVPVERLDRLIAL